AERGGGVVLTNSAHGLPSARGGGASTSPSNALLMATTASSCARGTPFRGSSTARGEQTALSSFARLLPGGPKDVRRSYLDRFRPRPVCDSLCWHGDRCARRLSTAAGGSHPTQREITDLVWPFWD